LKPENILLSKEGNVVITDFGLAKEGLHGDNARTETRAGTPEYLAPEVIKGNKYTKAVDWWSVGILIFVMLTGSPPFVSEQIQQLFEKIIKSPVSFPKTITPDSTDLITKLLQKEPVKRLDDPIKICAHPWFKGIDWKKLMAKEIPPPFVPKVSDDLDISNIDPTFLKEDVDDEDEKDKPPNDKISVNDIFVGFTYAL